MCKVGAKGHRTLQILAYFCRVTLVQVIREPKLFGAEWQTNEENVEARVHDK